MQKIMKLVFKSRKDSLDRKFGYFELFGFDFMLDNDLSVKILELNTNPALFTNTNDQQQLLPPFVDKVNNYYIYNDRLLASP